MYCGLYCTVSPPPKCAHLIQLCIRLYTLEPPIEASCMRAPKPLTELTIMGKASHILGGKHDMDGKF